MTIHSLACTATYEGTIDAGEFRRILKNPSLPAGIVAVDWMSSTMTAGPRGLWWRLSPHVEMYEVRAWRSPPGTPNSTCETLARTTRSRTAMRKSLAYTPTSRRCIVRRP